MFSIRIRRKTISRDTRKSLWTHAAGKTNADVVVFNVKYQVFMKTLPFDLSNSFPNIKIIVVRNNQLKKFTNRMVSGLRQLTDIDLSYNQIEYVGPHLFIENPKINRIILYPVKWVDPTALQSALVSMNPFDFKQNINYRKACWMDSPPSVGTQSYNAAIASETWVKVVVNCRPDADYERSVSLEALLMRAESWDSYLQALDNQVVTLKSSLKKCGCTVP